MWSTKAQISLCIRVALWSGPSLSANKIIRYYRMYKWRAKARVILWACAWWSNFCAFCTRSKALFHLTWFKLTCIYYYVEAKISADQSVPACKVINARPSCSKTSMTRTVGLVYFDFIYSEPSLQRQHLFPKTLPFKLICYCTELLMSWLRCKKGLVLFLFPHRTYVLDIC